MKKMIIVTLLVLLLPVSGMAASNTFNRHWSITDTCDATGPGSTYLGFGGTVSFSGMVPTAQIANVTSDLATSAVYILTENGDSTTLDAAYSSGAKILPVTATTSFQDDTAGAGSWIAIIDYTNKKFEVNRVSSITAGASLNLVRNTANTYANGSTVLELTNTLGKLAVGNATKDWETMTVYGEPGEVLGLYLDGTASCSINYIAGGYVGQ